MYVCYRCKAEFEEPCETPGDFWNPPEYNCPACGAGWDGKEAVVCFICGNYRHPDDMATAHCCSECEKILEEFADE